MNIIGVKKVLFDDTNNTVIATFIVEGREYEGKFAHHRTVKKKLKLSEFKKILKSKKID